MTDYLFIDFANSALYDGNGNLEDRLLDDAWCRDFRSRWDLKWFGPLTGEDVAGLSRLRAAIRAIGERVRVGRRPTPRDVATVNEFLAAAPVRFALSSRADTLETVRGAASELAGVAGEIALSAARYVAGDDRGRLKMCDNGGCRWMFHDDTKNRSRRWCRVCGNVDKVRRFRDRQRARERGKVDFTDASG